MNRNVPSSSARYARLFMGCSSTPPSPAPDTIPRRYHRFDARPRREPGAAVPQPRLQGPARPARAISSLGDAVSFTALPLLVLALTGSGFAMGIVGAAPDAARPLLRDGRRGHRRPQRSQADDVPGRPRTGRPDRAHPALGRPRRPDDGGHPARGGTDERPPLVLPGGLHRVGPGARRTQPGRPGELLFRGRLLDGLHRRSGHRRHPGRDDRPGRRPSPSTRCRSRCRRSGCCSSGATCALRSIGRDSGS